MEYSDEFLRAVLDSVDVGVAVIEDDGKIVFVNDRWITFGQRNGVPDTIQWLGVNYLAVCEEAAEAGDCLALKAVQGIKQILHTEQHSFSLEYPCHSDAEKRWFMMRVSCLVSDGKRFCVLSHQNITERKLAEEKVLSLSRQDGLTGLCNRRYFDEFYQQEWNRCLRQSLPITLVLFDIDHFKSVNDVYGHQVGDQHLRSVAQCANTFAKRPGDICARYGGEEFVLVLGNTKGEEAAMLATRLVSEIEALDIPNEMSPASPVLTISARVVTRVPDKSMHKESLIKEADRLLYMAKKKGRNQLCTATEGTVERVLENSLI